MFERSPEFVTRDEHDRLLQRIDAMERVMNDLSQRVAKHLEPTVEEHDDRLDAVEHKQDQFSLVISNVSNEQRRQTAEMTRLATQQERVLELLVGHGRQLKDHGEVFEVLVRNTSQTLALLGDRK